MIDRMNHGISELNGGRPLAGLVVVGEVGGALVLAATRRRRRWSGWWAAFPKRFGWTRSGRPRAELFPV
jgi:hypothetical protein